MSLDLLVHLSVQPSVARSFFCSTLEYLLVCKSYSGSTPPRKIIRTPRIALVPTIGVGWSGLARPKKWQTWFSPSSHWSLNWFLPLEMQFYPSHVLLVRAFWFEMLLKQITLVNPFGSYLTLTNFSSETLEIRTSQGFYDVCHEVVSTQPSCASWMIGGNSACRVISSPTVGQKYWSDDVRSHILPKVLHFNLYLWHLLSIPLPETWNLTKIWHKFVKETLEFGEFGGTPGSKRFHLKTPTAESSKLIRGTWRQWHFLQQ